MANPKYKDDLLNEQIQVLNAIIKDEVENPCGDNELDALSVMEEVDGHVELSILYDNNDLLPTIINSVLMAGHYCDKVVEYTFAALGIMYSVENYAEVNDLPSVVPALMIEKLEDELEIVH